MAPFPERGSGLHRVVLLLLKHGSRLTSDAFSGEEQRYRACSSHMKANISRLVNMQRLADGGPEIVGYNFFQTCWTRTVSDVIFKDQRKSCFVVSYRDALCGRFGNGIQGASIWRFCVWARTVDCLSMGLNKETFLSGSFSSAVACFALQPLDVLKTRIQENAMAPRENYGRATRYLRLSVQICRVNGPLGFWRGLCTQTQCLSMRSHSFAAPTLIRNVPGAGLYFWLLDGLRQAAPTHSHAANLATGSTARILAGMVLMPFTILKIQMEVSIRCFSYHDCYFRAESLAATAATAVAAECCN